MRDATKYHAMHDGNGFTSSFGENELRLSTLSSGRHAKKKVKVKGEIAGKKLIFDSEDLESGSRYLQSTLRDLMSEYFPAKTVRMSTRDPPWLTPLAKALLERKSQGSIPQPGWKPN